MSPPPRTARVRSRHAASGFGGETSLQRRNGLNGRSAVLPTRKARGPRRLRIYANTARAAADAADARAALGVSLGPLDGAIITIKDLFDVAGEPTRAGSKVLAEEAKPAIADNTLAAPL